MYIVTNDKKCSADASDSLPILDLQLNVDHKLVVSIAFENRHFMPQLVQDRRLAVASDVGSVK